jgi:hypothetical protein
MLQGPECFAPRSPLQIKNLSNTRIRDAVRQNTHCAVYHVLDGGIAEETAGE